MIAAVLGTSSVEEVARANGSGLRWFQVYVFSDKQITANLVRRAEKTGYKALVITVDHPITGKRLDAMRNDLSLPDHLSLKNVINSGLPTAYNSLDAQQQLDGVVYDKKYVGKLLNPELTWDDIRWVKTLTKLPVIVKGILTGEDAKLAVQHGVDGIIVSNHGGRQLDGVLATVSFV